MQYRLINGDEILSQTISRFYGLNRLEKGRNGEFSDMLGLSSDRYPCMSPARRARKLYDDYTNIQAVIAPKYDEILDGLTGVADGIFYYNGKAVDFDDENMSIPSYAAVTLADFNGRIIICAYYTDTDGKAQSLMYYYGYTASDENKVKRMENGIYGIAAYTILSSGDPETDYAVTNTIYAASVTWSDYFSEGDAVCISGLEKENNNTLEIDSKFLGADRSKHISAIVEKVDGHTIYVQLYNYLGERLVFTKESKTSGGNLGVYINIPTMNHICIHNNRLWGTNPNGEYVYASKLGDPFNWNTFQGLANDSFYAKVGTAGGFVGIVSYRDNLVAFKRDYIHHIYGDKPSNFTIPKQLSDCGCVDIRSAVQIGTSLYFLGYGGFYEYMGGQPELISEKLDRKYISAAAATDGQKYIVSCRDTEGSDELLVYDTRRGIWHREHLFNPVDSDEQKERSGIIGSFRRGEKLYISSAEAVYEYSGKDTGEWFCEGVIMNESTFDNSGIIELWIRARLDEGANVKVLTAEDGGAWVGSFTMTQTGLNVYRIPVRFISGDFYQFRLEGKGNAVIYDIERRVSAGGRGYRLGNVTQGG